MEISFFAHEGHDRAREVSATHDIDLTILSHLILQKSWSPSVYKPDETGLQIRNKANFAHCDILALDIDSDVTLQEAMQIFQGYSFSIATTKSHQKVKTKPSGASEPACDRYRVLIPLEGRIGDSDVYRATWDSAYKLWPFIDKACKDPSRYYAKSKDLIYLKTEGLRFPVCNEVQQSQPVMPVQHQVSVHPNVSLSKSTYEFLADGAPQGKWHHRLVSACLDMKGIGYTYEQAVHKLTDATRSFSGFLDQNDLSHIVDVYENREATPNKYQAAQINGMIAPTANTYQMPTGHMTAPPTIPKNVTYQESSPDDIMQNILADRARRHRALAINYPFICSAFHNVYRFTMGFIIIGAKSGKGKSTVLANILAHILEQGAIKKKILVISNEENTEDVYSRIACLMCGYDWIDYRNDSLTAEEFNKIDAVLFTLPQKIIVQSLTSGKMEFHYIEDFMSTLDYAEKQQNENGFEMIMFDYWQTINQSRENPSLSAMEISKKLGFQMKEFAARVGIPTVAFAQLKGDDKLDIKDRVENDKTLYNHAQDFIEITPNFETKKSTFIFHKNRWGYMQGKFITTVFDKGRYMPNTIQEEV